MANNYSNYPINQQATQPIAQSIYPTMQQMPQMTQIAAMPSFFPQPIGNVYNLTTAAEIGNIPAGNGLSVGLCLAEGVMYVKSLQNGAPVLVEYRLSTSDGGGRNIEQEGVPNEEVKRIYQTLDKYEEKFGQMESQIKHLKTKLGGNLEWQI